MSGERSIWHGFQRPAKVEIETHSSTFGRFIAQPFERGWGTTVGNALRRALLSSIPGAAVTAVRIRGVEHEFSTVPGVVEDVTDIILNLKSISWRVHTLEPVFLDLRVKGPGVVTAGQFKLTHAVEVVDPNAHIATLSEDGELDMTVRLAVARGYVPAEDNGTPDLDESFIPIDSSHSPIKKANFRVESARVGRVTTYERLVLEVWTDGSILPKQALATAAQLIQGHLELYSMLGEFAEEVTIAPSEEEEAKTVLDEGIEVLGLSNRALNSLKNGNIETIRDLVTKSEKELMALRNFGEKMLKEVKEKLEARGLGLGMELQPEG